MTRRHNSLLFAHWFHSVKITACARYHYYLMDKTRYFTVVNVLKTADINQIEIMKTKVWKIGKHGSLVVESSFFFFADWCREYVGTKVCLCEYL